MECSQMTDASLEVTNKLLRVIVGLLLRPKSQSDLKLKEQVEILDGFGLRPVEIAQILGRTATHINKELAGIRKKKRPR
jgi:hypothetical protein